jgi:hypothetical protein
MTAGNERQALDGGRGGAPAGKSLASAAELRGPGGHDARSAGPAGSGGRGRVLVGRLRGKPHRPFPQRVRRVGVVNQQAHLRSA